MTQQQSELVHSPDGDLELPAEVAGLRLSLVRRQTVRRVWLDTPDHRLRQRGVALVVQQAAGSSLLTLSGAGDGDISQVPVTLPPAWASELPPSMAAIRQVVDVRALLPIVTADAVVTRHAALDSLDKTVARVAVERYTVGGEPAQTRIRVEALRGYEKHAARLTRALRAAPGIVDPPAQLVDVLLSVSGLRTPPTNVDPGAGLTRDVPASEAFAVMFRRMLESIRTNVDGAVSDIDSEFLHDLRVAVRRTRTALKLAGDVVPPGVREDFGPRFRWLGDVTTPARDLDVHLLDFPALLNRLGDQAAALEPLHAHLARQRRAAHRQLARDLRSRRFTELIDEWSTTLDAGWPPPGPAPTLGEVADRCVAWTFGRVIKRGSRIADESPPEALHDLRKRCKELRYALEFFAVLYDGPHVKDAVKELKSLQDNLGEFQDSEVQRAAVEGWATELARQGAPVETLLAMGRISAHLDDRQAAARSEFGKRFATFARPVNRRRFDEIVGG